MMSMLFGAAAIGCFFYASNTSSLERRVHLIGLLGLVCMFLAIFMTPPVQKELLGECVRYSSYVEDC